MNEGEGDNSPFLLVLPTFSKRASRDQHSELDKAGLALNAERPHDVVLVERDRAGTNSQGMGDLHSGPPFAQEEHDLLLAWRQPVKANVASSQAEAVARLGNSRRKVSESGENLRDCRAEFIAPRVFGNEPVRTGAESCLGQSPVEHHRDDDDLDGGLEATYVRDEFKAIPYLASRGPAGGSLPAAAATGRRVHHRRTPPQRFRTPATRTCLALRQSGGDHRRE